MNTFLKTTRGIVTMNACNVPTIREYYQSTFLDRIETKFIETGKDDLGIYCIFEKTIFHPQGGGQPSDKGFISSASSGEKQAIIRLSEDKESGVIRHYVEKEPQFLTGDLVEMTINLAERILYAKLHTGGHLLSGIMEKLYPQVKGIRGNHFPGGQAFVVFQGDPLPKKEGLKEAIEENLKRAIEGKLPIVTDNSGQTRTVNIEGIIQYPCGGTHLGSTEQIGSITIRSIKTQKNELRIGYEIQ